MSVASFLKTLRYRNTNGFFSTEQSLNKSMQVEGQITRDENKLLMNLAELTPINSVIVEIGSFRGRSTVALAYGALRGNQNTVYAIDPHEVFKGVRGGSFGPQDKVELYRNLLKAKVAQIVSVVCLSSTQVGKGWAQKNVGLLWIDGDHRYEMVHADFEAWHPNLIAEAIVAFHDTDSSGVAKFIAEKLAEGQLSQIGAVGNLAWFKIFHERPLCRIV